MGQHYTDLYTTQTMSTTGTRERDVADTIRHLYPGSNWMPMIAQGKVPTPKGANEGVKKQKNMFGKRQVYSSKFEAFTFTPLAIEFTVTSYSDPTLVLTSTEGLVAKYTLINSNNGTTCFINTVDSGGTDLNVTSYGGTDFSVSAGDKLVCLSPHYEEKSSSPSINFKDPDNLYNLTYIFRHAVGISDTAQKSKHYGGDRYMHIRQENGADAMRKASNNLIFDNKPASSAEKNTSGLSTSFGSCDGIYQWAQTSHDFGGSMTKEAFMQDMPLSFHESVGINDKKVMWCGYAVWSVILGWINEGTLQAKPGTYAKWGIESYNILTARGYVEVMLLDVFDRGNFATQALIVCPEKIDYVFYKGRDMQVRENIQGNSVDGREDEIYGEISVCPDDNGYSIMKLINCVPLAA